MNQYYIFLEYILCFYYQIILPILYIPQLQEHLDNCAHCAEAKNLEELVRAKIKSSCAQQAPEAMKTKLMGYIDEFCATA